MELINTVRTVLTLEVLHVHESDRRYTASGTKFSRDAQSVLDLNLVPIHD
eukprot:SAG31_NODE_778_length_12161_cov_101.601807_13_plen_50_part_00